MRAARWMALALALAPVAGIAMEQGFERIQYRDWRIRLKDGFLAYQNKQYDRAFELPRRNACAGDKQSQFELGGMYLLGQGTEPDALKAYAWMRSASETGDLEFRHAADALAAQIPPVHHDAAEALVGATIGRYGLKATNMTCTEASALGSHRAMRRRAGFSHALSVRAARDGLTATLWLTL